MFEFFLFHAFISFTCESQKIFSFDLSTTSILRSNSGELEPVGFIDFYSQRFSTGKANLIRFVHCNPHSDLIFWMLRGRVTLPCYLFRYSPNQNVSVKLRSTEIRVKTLCLFSLLYLLAALCLSR